MSKKTVKEVLRESFDKFKNKALPIVENELETLCNFEDEDLLDALDMLMFLFPSDDTELHLNQLMELKSISVTEEQFNELLPLVKRFVNHLKEIKSLI